MASPVNALVCALIATAFWSLLGYALGSRLVPRVLAIGAAPVIGWSVHSAATLPIYLLFGFSPLLVAGIGAVCVLIAGFSLSQPRSAGEIEPAQTIPVLAFAAAAFVALLPAATILPKSSGGAVWLADATFDHAKIAMIDAMARLGLPPVNPVFGEADASSGLAYYYLWHFSAAEIALITSMSGWEADVGLTWFTAFASLSLMMGLAVWLSKRAAAAIFGGGAGRGRFAVGDALLDIPSQKFRAGAGAADRNGRLALSGHMGSATSDGGVLRRDRHAPRHPLRLAAKLDLGRDHRLARRCRL